MSSQLPMWAQYLEALSTLVIGGLAGFIAFMQWRTTHQTVVLELFDRRLELATSILSNIARLLQEAKVSNEASATFLRVTREAEFLFGKDVTDYLDRTYTLLIDLHVADMEIEATSDAVRRKAIEGRRWMRDELARFIPELKKLLRPYLYMHHKGILA